MTTESQTLDDRRRLLRAVSAYVPDSVSRRAVLKPTSPLLGWEERRRAVLLFADVSGFTAMSESLARLGKEGAEELTRVLNLYFTTMIDLVHQHDGEIIRFGGDALTCQFDGGRQGVLQACACALAMQKAVRGFLAVDTKGGVFSLRMKIGISGGTVLSVNVGDEQRGMEYVLAGRPLDRMVAAEHHAAAGEVMLDGELPSVMGSCWEEMGISTGESRYGFAVLVATHTVPPPRTREPIPWATLPPAVVERALARLIPYLPPTVYERLSMGQREFVGEHRWVVSLFVRFAGLNYDDPEAGTKLQRYFTTMQEVVLRYEGRLNRVITGDKGSLLHIIFGAPVTHEDDEERAVRCALDLQRVAADHDRLPFITDQRIGIASGYVFAGDVGSERRREYTVMGDVVNLSARLMQAAESHQILSDRSTTRRVESTCLCNPLSPIRVKGKRDPVPVFLITGLRKRQRRWLTGEIIARQRGTPIVGRERELEQIANIIRQVETGHGHVVTIRGEAGTGKSRLLQEVFTMAQSRGAYIAGGTCLSYGARTPYLPWIEFFNTFFELEGEGESTGQTAEERQAENLRRLRARMVEADPNLEAWVPLLAQLLGLSVPDTPLTAALTTELRKQRIFEIVLTLLRHQAQQVPLFLIIFEDVHWIDTISLELLDYVARNIAGERILLMIPHRPTIDLTEWQRYTHCYEIELGELPVDDALKLIQHKLGMEQVPDSLRRRVLGEEKRVNPFFVEEVLNALVDQGYLLAVPSEDGGYEYILSGDLSQAEIPDSIQALVMSRIDRLDESSKLTIKVASVIGRVFQYRVLWAIYPVPITPEQLLGNLEKLNRIDLTPMDKPAPDWEYIFKHVTTQEVAYESLLYAHRRDLHGRVARYLEETYRNSLEEYYELLAYHYTRSDDREKGWYYLIRAADKARSRYANDSAIAYYRQALELGLDGAEAGRVYESLGDVYRVIGEYSRAEENYREALKLHPLPARAAELRRKIAKIWQLQGRYEEARNSLLWTRESLEGASAPLVMARIYTDMAWLEIQRGNYEEARALCHEGLRLCEQVPDRQAAAREQASLQHTLGSIDLRVGAYDQAIEHFRQCIEVNERAGDLYNMGRSYNNMAVVYWSQGNYTQAAEYLQQSLDIFRRIGYAHGTAMCYNNLGGIYFTLGEYERAIENYKQSLEIRQRIGDVQGIADVHNNLGEVYRSLGNYREAQRYLRQAAANLEDLGDKTTLVDTYRLLAEVEVALKNVEDALRYGERALALAQELENREYTGIALRVLGQIHRTAGQLNEARRQLEASIKTLEETANKLELGRSCYELGITLRRAGTAQADTYLRRALQIFESLGVVAEADKVRQQLR